MPGAVAIVNSRPSQAIVTKSMVDQATNVLGRLRAVGSVSLQTDIDTQLTRSHNLQDFIGLDFEQTLRGLGFPLPVHAGLPGDLIALAVVLGALVILPRLRRHAAPPARSL